MAGPKCGYFYPVDSWQSRESVVAQFDDKASATRYAEERNEEERKYERLAWEDGDNYLPVEYEAMHREDCPVQPDRAS